MAALNQIEQPYADAALLYVERGWLSPIPLGRAGVRAQKKPVPKGFTGRAGVEPSPEQIEEWRASHGPNNIGVHLGDGRVGVDCDHYGDKRGADTLAALVANLGPLPPTYRSTSRGWANPSGIRVFRTPPGVEFAGIIGPGVEIIQRKHRYAAVWPSVHPDTGERYVWFDPDGNELDIPPDAEDLPDLPEAWVERFREDRAGGVLAVASLERKAAVEWLNAHGSGEPCRAVAGVLRSGLSALETASSEGTSRYDTAVRESMALLHLAGEGHRGARGALKVLRDAYHEAVADVPNRDPSEWSRMVHEGVAKVASATDEDFWEFHPADACPGRDGGVARLWPSPAAPYDVAERAVDELWRLNGPGSPATLSSWRGDWYEWTGTHWRTTSAAPLRACLYSVLKSAAYLGGGTGAPTELLWRPDAGRITRVLDAVAAIVLHSEHAERAERVEGGVREIPMASSVLRLSDRRELPHSPERFNLTALPFAWSPVVPEPTEWLKFLDSLWPDDEPAVALLQEWLGYLVSGETRMQKALLLIGQRRSGKGTIGHVVNALLGADASCAPLLSSLAGRFGLQPLVGKSSAIVGDAKLTGRDAAEVVGKLLTVIGEDSVSVERKNLGAPWEGVLGTRFTLLSNSVPNYVDPSGALAGRFLPLHTLQTFYGREDLGLRERLLGELPSILTWALEGLDRLHARGHFTEPESSREITDAMHADSSPVRAFLRDCARRVPVDLEGGVVRKVLYAAYRSWCEDEGRRAPLTMAAFSNDLRAVVPEAMGKGHQVWRDGERVRVYYAIELREHWLRVGEDAAGSLS